MQEKHIENKIIRKRSLRVMLFFSSAYFFTKYGHFSELLSSLQKNMSLFIVSVSGSEINKSNMEHAKIGLGEITEHRIFCYLLIPIIALQLSIFCIRNKIDVLIGFNGGYPQLVTHLASIISHKPFVVYVRVDHTIKNEISKKSVLTFIWNTIVNISLKYSTHIISLSKFLNEKAVSWGVSREKTSIIPFGIDTNLFKPLPLNEKYPNSVLFIGRWSPEKGTGLLLQIANRLLDFNFILIGVSQTKIKIRQPNLHPLGYVPHDDIPKYMTLGKVVLSTSLTEGQPMACLEALACGKPVVANRAGALPDFIIPEVGWVFEKNSVDSAVEILKKALNDEQILSVKGENARSYAMNFSWDVHQEKVAKLLQMLIDGGGGKY
jgi:glycosyltransferase involved in cell wall biosynthesis